MELEITWCRALKVWWAFFWRSLIAMVVASIVGAIVGFFIGLVMGFLGAPPRALAFVAVITGMAIGLGLSVVPMKMILGKDFGRFRLVLIAKEAKV